MCAWMMFPSLFGFNEIKVHDVLIDLLFLQLIALLIHLSWLFVVHSLQETCIWIISCDESHSVGDEIKVNMKSFDNIFYQICNTLFYFQTPHTCLIIWPAQPLSQVGY
ncbi:hypothetical protein R6Q59_009657 [Mikania micrantha]